MRKKRVSKEKVAEIIRLIKEGKDIKQIAADFDVSVATVYNYKTRSARAGVSLPKAKRGRKPKMATPSAPTVSAAAAAKSEFKKLPVSVGMESYNFIINGVRVTVSGKASNVHIASDHMVVNF
ncbi:MAG: Hin recombinase [Chitinophagia bacterium]|nr:Hin recombinase [Chitinophagia bacterium]